MKIKKNPLLFLEKNDILLLNALLTGVYLACDKACQEWNCLSGFNDYCDKVFHDDRALNWAHKIAENYPKEEAIPRFFELLDAFLEERSSKGFPMTVPPPHLEKGGIYRIKGTPFCFVVLDYEQECYLLAVMRDDDLQLPELSCSSEELLSMQDGYRTGKITWEELFDGALLKKKVQD